MAEVIITLKIMPSSPETDLDVVRDTTNSIIEKKYGETQTKVETKEIAFGLKALLITFVIDESRGSTDDVEEQISKTEGVNSVEVVDVRRTLG